MRSSLIVPALVLACLVIPDASVAKPKASTPEERAKAVKLARELEADPLTEDAVGKRQWLIKWWEKVPDITVIVCNLLGPFPKDDHPYFSEVFVQSLFSSGAFMIEHPEQANDQALVQTAGVEGSLKVYLAFLKAVPEGRLPFLDDLEKKRAAGELTAHIRDALPKACE